MLFRLAGEDNKASDLDSYLESIEGLLAQPRADLQVFLRNDISTGEKEEIEAALKGDSGIRRIDFISRAEAFEEFQGIFANDPDILENVTLESMPESFRVYLDNPSDAGPVRLRTERLPGIDEVREEVGAVPLPAPPSSLIDPCLREGFLGLG